MRFRFDHKRIRGILSVLPAHEQLYVDDMKRFGFPEARSMKLKMVMGYDRHRLVEEGVCASDLAVFGLERLFAEGRIAPDDLDALIVVTQSPDYFMPPTSNVVQGRLGLKQDCLCLDIAQGCAGFVVGLLEAFMLLEQDSVNNVALVNVDVLSRKVSPEDRNSYPLVGDGAAITIVGKSADSDPIYANLKMDGTRREALIIPAGGFRMPHNPETAILTDEGDGNKRALDHLRMDGTGVFNFVQVDVPPMLQDIMDHAGCTLADIEHFLFHQPNRFMLEKLAEAIGVDYSKITMDIVERFGNSSGVTIPLVACTSLAGELRRRRMKVCLAGFGVGLTVASMVLNLGALEFVGQIDYP